MLKIYTLIDARRQLRPIYITTEKRDAFLKQKTTRDNVAETKNVMSTLSAHLQQAQSDFENVQEILIALKTELRDETNSCMVRLRRLAETCNGRIESHIQQIEQRLAGLTTHYDSKLQVLLKDLERRFAKHYKTRFLVRQVQDREIGVLFLGREQSSKSAFCVIMTEPMTVEESAAIKKVGSNQYKLFFNAIPSDIALENFHPFLSPSKATQDIMRTLGEEGF